MNANMDRRPILDLKLDSNTFKEYYYLKEELVDFCRKHNLQSTGSKAGLTLRIAAFLDTGNKTTSTLAKKKALIPDNITLDTKIEENFKCTQKHREFFKEHIGSGFSFNVRFQKWLKENFAKTYQDAIEAYYQILEDKKNNTPAIDKQFEYNTYIRDFFNDNKDKSLHQAIVCWKYKKSLRGSNKYERGDLTALNTDL